MAAHEDSEPADGELDRLRREMHAELGRCMIRLQKYELLMKAFATRQQVEGPVVELFEVAKQREKRFANSTLGQVVGEVADATFLAPGMNRPGVRRTSTVPGCRWRSQWNCLMTFARL